jgi:DNA-binding transcriptional MerR regulator
MTDRVDDAGNDVRADQPEVADDDGGRLLTLEELTARVDLSVRNIRFYTSRGLVPPPIRRGRSGYYSADHVARLELVRELQGHGFTLAAIEGYLARVPESASPEDIALHRAMLAPWMSETPVEMDHAELEQRAGRILTDDDVATLGALGIVRVGPRPGVHRVALAQLSTGLGMLDLGFPREAAEAAGEVYAKHGREIAEELHELFRTMVWPLYKETETSREKLTGVVERLKPLSVASLVSAYEAAMDEKRRQDITQDIERRRTP